MNGLKMRAFFAVMVFYTLTAIGGPVRAFAQTASVEEQVLSVLVLPFISTNPATGIYVTELLRNGLAAAPFLRVLEEGDATYLLEGSVDQIDSDLVLSYRLFDRALGRVELAGSATIRAATMQQDGAAVAAVINNALLASYAGSTPEAVDALIRAGRYDDARRRLESLAARGSGNEEVLELQRRVDRGLAEAWRIQALAELEEARKARGEGVLRMAAQARNSLESALLLLPEGEAERAQRDSIVAILSGPVKVLIERGRKETEQDYAERMKSALSSDAPEDALRMFEDFIALYGESAPTKELHTLQRKAAVALSSSLASRSTEALRAGNLWLALALAGQALDADSGSGKASLAYERSSKAIEEARAREEIERSMTFSGLPPFRASWGYGMYLGMYGSNGEDFSFPIQGIVPVFGLGLQRILRSGDSLMFAFGGRLGYGTAQNTIDLFGTKGKLDVSLAAASLGAELSTRIDLEKAAIRPALLFDIGATYYSWTAAYKGGSVESSQALVPSFSAGFALAFVPNKAWEIRFCILPTGSLVFDYGLSGGLRLMLEARYLP
ncbi:hypothetical protein MASR2M78_14780 [Treponema sp.]